MSRKNNHNKRRGSQPKMDEFPDEFDDSFFHNELVDINRRIPILRNTVFRKVKEAVTERVHSYGSNVPLEDHLDVTFPTEGFTEFEWAVVREEIMSQGIDVTSEFKEGRLFSISVHIEREISLTTTMKDMERDEDESESDYSESERGDSETESDVRVETESDVRVETESEKKE
jgi:hypothetical protein